METCAPHGRASEPEQRPFRPDWLERTRRVRLAEAARGLARDERRSVLGALAFWSVGDRVELCERIATRLEALELPVGQAGLEELLRLVGARRHRLREHMIPGGAREARLASILSAIDKDRHALEGQRQPESVDRHQLGRVHSRRPRELRQAV